MYNDYYGSQNQGDDLIPQNNPEPEVTSGKLKKLEKKLRRTVVTAVVVCCAFSLVLGAAGGVLVGYRMIDQNSTSQSLASEADSQQSSQEDANGANSENSGVLGVPTSTGGNDEIRSYADVVKKVADAVVAINVDSTQTMYGFGASQEYAVTSSGSGVIISEDGYIVTNNHVIEGADKITVILRDGTQYEAVLVGTDSQTDVALLKIEATGLTYAAFGDSDALEVGEPALVIGNPLGEFQGSFTAGYISGVGRDITIDGAQMTLLQTDAAVNPGNSGGGLFNDRGELVGIVVAKTQGTDVEGLGFAIPVSLVKDVLEELREYGYVTGRPYLGVELLDINSQQMMFMYRVDQEGVYIYAASETGAAYKAGLRAGDCILAVDGTEIESSEQLKNIVKSLKAGDTLQMEIYRYGETFTVDVVLLEETPYEPAAA